MTSALGEPNAIAITFFLLFIALSLGITVWASQEDANRRALLRRRPKRDGVSERPRARRRLHERRELPRHRRTGRHSRDSTA